MIENMIGLAKFLQSFFGFRDLCSALCDTIVDPWLLFLLLSLWSYKIPGKDAGRDDNLSIRSDLHFFEKLFNFEKFLISNLNILITFDVL